jgi:hypothetical protein
MNKIRFARLFVLLLLMGVSVPGCGGGLFNTEPFVDSNRDEHGNVILLDTDRNWEDWREAIDPQIRAEAAGRSPPGAATWNESWILILSALQKSQENAPKYIKYILEERRRASLPELEGYPPERASQ